MADTIFRTVLPVLKAVDNRDDTYSVSIEEVIVPGGGTDTIFANVFPPLKAVDLGDGTYAIAVTPV